MTDAMQGVGQRFLLEAFVARGAWAAVYRGRDAETGERVAIKRLHEHLCEPGMIEQFEQEARLLGKLKSPYVVRYVTHGLDEEGHPYLALEWLEGQDLSQWKRSKGLTQRQVVQAIQKVALGLAALHREGAVHSDVKPSNFFVIKSGQEVDVKLFDLGIARAHAEGRLTAAGATLGTPAYMSPEQARGQQTLTPQSDLFSCGVMLFELLAGKKPYRADDMTSLVMKIVLQDPPRLRDQLPSAPKELDEIVARAMGRNPEDRFATGEELAAALSQAPVSDEPVRSSGRRGAARAGNRGGRIMVVEGTGLHQAAGIGQGPGALMGMRLGPAMPISAVLEQRVVTAIFASFAATAEPGPAIDTFKLTAENHGGTFHDMLGPRRVAVFGASGARGDEAERAARAALQAASITGIRLAIVTGQAVAREGVLSGGVIERGIREVERCRDEVRIDESTARFLEGRFEIEGSKGERVLRPAKVDPGSFGSKLLGQATPLVGRERECASLMALFEQCVSEPVARAVLITGPAGAGKSRLCHEALGRITAERSPSSPLPRPTVLLGRGDPVSAGAPFGMLAPAIRRLAGIVDGEPIETRKRKLEARLAETLDEPTLSRALPFIGELARVPFSDEHHPALRAARQNPILMNDAMRTAWEDWILGECSRHPLLLVLEDLHWGDLPSIQFVDTALRIAKSRPLMVLSVARNEVHAQFPGLWSGRDLEEMRLGALTRKASEKLVHHVLGPDVKSEVVNLVVERADGNPFYLEELIRAVAEGGKDELPDTVLGMVQARLDSLGPEAKRLLRAASIFGQTFWLGGVRALFGGTELTQGVASVLDRLANGEVVVRRATSSIPSEIEYAFTHALVREGAYATLTEEGRAEGHHLAGEWLNSRGWSNAAVLADHFARAGDSGEAREWYLRAAEQALEGSDLVAAIDRAERGIAAAAEGELLGHFRLIQAEAHRFRGELAAAEAQADEALSRLPQGSLAWLRAAAELAASASLRGHIERVEWMAREVNLAAVDPHLRSARVVCLCRAAIPLFWAGHPSADGLFAEVDGLVEPVAELDHQAQGMLHFSRATRALFAGRPGAHLIEQRAARAAFQEGGDARNACRRAVSVGFALGELGSYAEAEEALRSALAASERMGTFNITARGKSHLGNILCRLGRLDEARSVEQLAVTLAAAQGEPRLEALSRVYLAEVHRRAGDLAAAEREARKAIEIAASSPTVRVFALGTLAFVQLTAGKPREAREAIGEAMAGLNARGQTDEGESLLRLIDIKVRRAMGEEAEARGLEHRAYQRVMERAMSIEDPRWRESFLAIPENVETVNLARSASGAS